MTHRCFCGSTGESTRCSTFWLWSEVRAWPLPNLSLYPQTYTSAYWNGKNWLYYPKLEYYFDSKVSLIDHSTICFFSILFSTSCHLTPSEFQEEKKKTLQGSPCYLWNESAYLPDTSLSTECLCLLRESTRQRLPPVWLWSSPSVLWEEQRNTHTFYVCLPLQRFSWLPHRHWCSKKRGHQRFSGPEMNRTRTCERENRRKVCCSATNQFRGTLTTQQLLPKHSSFFCLVFFQGCSRAGWRNRLTTT